MAPLYDAVTTRVFSNLKHERLALKLNDRDNKLRRADLQSLPTMAGLRAGAAEGAVDEVFGRLSQALGGFALPKDVDFSEETRRMADEVPDICHQGIEGIDLPRLNSAVHDRMDLEWMIYRPGQLSCGTRKKALIDALSEALTLLLRMTDRSGRAVIPTSLRASMVRSSCKL